MPLRSARSRTSSTFATTLIEKMRRGDVALVQNGDRMDRCQLLLLRGVAVLPRRDALEHGGQAMSAAPEPPYHPGSLRSMFEAYWPHRDTYSGRAVLRRIIAAMKTNREVTRGW